MVVVVVVVRADGGTWVGVGTDSRVEAEGCRLLGLRGSRVAFRDDTCAEQASLGDRDVAVVVRAPWA